MKAIISVLGKDKVGITAHVCNILASRNVNILDISQTINETYFTMLMIVEISSMNVSFAELAKELEQCVETIGVNATIQREEIFSAMHRL